MPKIKITVVKKINLDNLYGDNPTAVYNKGRIVPECDRFNLGQEFITEDFNCPMNFCNWAFADIQRNIVHVFWGVHIPG
jgi:uncharacterized repeat protein (TIGR04076 family)